MNAPVRLLLLGTSVSIGLATPPPGVAAQQPDPAVAGAAVGRVAGAAAERGFSGQVLAVLDGEVVFHEAFGLADAEEGVRTTLETVYAIGSVTKQFTRVAILELEEEGALDTSLPIGRYLDDVPDDKRDITVQQLLDMRAGFQEYHDDSGDHQPMTRAEALERILSQELRFEPGSERAYSNSGYTLLAAIVENVSGMSFPEYVRTALLEPHGLDGIGFHGDPKWEDETAARGRNGLRHGENAPHTWSLTWALMGAGGMVASAGDLEKWIRALRGGRVLGPAALAKAYRADGNALYAGGDDFGFQTGIVELDDGDDFVIANTNTGHDALRVATESAEAMTGEPLPFDVPGSAGAEGEESEGEPSGEQTARQSGVPDSPRARAAGAFLDALRSDTDEALVALVNDRFSAGMRDAFPMDAHVGELRRMRELVRTATEIGLARLGEHTVGIRLEPDGRTIVLDLDPEPPHLITGVRIEDDRQSWER